MNPTTKKSFEDACRQISPEQLDELQFQAKVFRILTSIYQTGSIDEEVITDYIFNHYNGEVPKESINEIVVDFLPYVLHETGLVFPDGKLTPEGVHIAQQHIQLFAEQSKPTIH